jgi:hypothetical protein
MANRTVDLWRHVSDVVQAEARLATPFDPVR